MNPTVTSRRHQSVRDARFPRPRTEWVFAPRLTERELQVIDLLHAGRSTREIAQQFGGSVKTVRNHISHLYEKLGVADRVALLGKTRPGRR